jgi:hypothetical protein
MAVDFGVPIEKHLLSPPSRLLSVLMSRRSDKECVPTLRMAAILEVVNSLMFACPGATMNLFFYI